MESATQEISEKPEDLVSSGSSSTEHHNNQHTNIERKPEDPLDGAAMDKSSAEGYSIPGSLKIKREASLNTVIRKKSEAMNHVLNVQTGQMSKFRDIERSLREIESRRELDSNNLRKIKDEVMILQFDLGQERKRNDVLEKQNEELSKVVMELKLGVDHMQKQIDSVEFYFEKQDREVQSMTNRLRTSEVAKSALEQENKELVTELSTHNEAMSKSIQDKKRLSSKLNIAEAERANLEAELKKYRDAYGNLGFMG